MSSVVDTVLVAALTSVVVTAAGDLTVKPRLAARTKRIQARHDYRDQLELRINNVLMNCRRLARYPILPTAPDEVSKRIEAERERWIKQLDDDTAWLIDNQLLVGAGAPRLGDFPVLVIRYAEACRVLWLIDRSLEDRCRMITELSDMAHRSLWGTRRFKAATRSRHLYRLRDRLDAIDAGSFG